MSSNLYQPSSSESLRRPHASTSDASDEISQDQDAISELQEAASPPNMIGADSKFLWLFETRCSLHILNISTLKAASNEQPSF